VAVKATVGDKDYLVPNITAKQTKKIMHAADCFLEAMKNDKPRDKD
jgi:Holliday junction resolvase-like predicted endonuclease